LDKLGIGFVAYSPLGPDTFNRTAHCSPHELISKLPQQPATLAYRAKQATAYPQRLIEKGKEKLSLSDLLISEIAYTLGF